MKGDVANYCPSKDFLKRAKITVGRSFFDIYFLYFAFLPKNEKKRKYWIFILNFLF